MASITLTIPDDKVAEFKAGFLRANRKPDNFDGTELEWIKYWGKENYLEAYKWGKKLLMEDINPPVIDEEIIE